MNTGGTEQFEPAHLAQWLETTRVYLYSEQESRAAPIDNALPQLRQDGHGDQDRFISRARGSLLRC